MNRREFLAAVAATGTVRLDASAPSRFSARPPVVHLDSESDIFACEREAQFIEGHFSSLLRTRTLPVARQHTAVSPIPAGYNRVDELISEAQFGTAPGSNLRDD